MKYLTSVFLMTLMLGLTSIGFAQQNRPGQDRYQQADMNRSFRQIPDLTDGQKEQIQALRLENQEAMLPIRNELNEKQAQLRTLTTGDNVDVDAAIALIEEIGTLQTEQMKLHLQHRMAVRGLLTEEQRIVFDTHAARGGGAKGMRPMHRGPRGRN